MDYYTLKDGFLGQRMIVLPDEVKIILMNNSITSSFYITDIGYYPRASHHLRSRMQGAEQYIFIYCTEGEGWLKINGRQLRILPNHFFMVSKKIPHSYGADIDNPWSIYWMHFNGTAVPSLFARYNMHSLQAIPIPYDSIFIKQFDQIFTILKSNYIESQLEHANILGLNFISFFIYYNFDQLTTTNGQGNLVDMIIDFLEKNIDQPFKSEQITNEFNYSPSYIFTIFKKRTGYSLIHFFNLKKVQKACEYIKYSDLNIKEISHKVGFQDPLYFSRLFKKHMGVSPKSYRNQLEN